MNLSDTAKQLIKELGGHENVIDVTHCMTRLRFRLKNEDIVDDAKVKSLSGVLGVSRSGGQYQVIIGNAVATYYRAVTDVLGISGHTENTAPVSAGKKKWTAKRFFGNIIDAISGSVAPILPAIIGCGMIKLLLIILGLLGVPDTNMTYRVLEIVGDAAFYFLPIMVAYTAAKKFGCNPVLAMTLTGLLLHPDLIALFSADSPVTFLRLPVTAATYSSSIIPPLLCTWVLSYVEKGIDKITPTWTKTIFKPMLVLLIMAPVSLVALAPLGTLIGAWVQGLFAWLLGLSGWLTMGIFAALLPLIIMTGMHYAFVPGALSDIGTLGYDPFLLPAMLASNLAQGAACLAVMIRTKNRELRSVAGAAAVSALTAGITEPALYGITLRLKKPLVAACIGSGIAGIFIGAFGVRSYAFTSPSLLAIVQFIAPEGGMNFTYAIAGAGIAIVATFIATLILGFEDVPKEDAAVGEMVDGLPDGETIHAPVAGEIIPLAEIPDETFASGVLGIGFGVRPSTGEVYAPFNGTVENVFETGHAIGLKSEKGTELLIHVGINTVTMQGEGFSPCVKNGDRVREGDVLLRFDTDSIRRHGLDPTVAVIVTNREDRAAYSDGKIIIKEGVS